MREIVHEPPTAHSKPAVRPEAWIAVVTCCEALLHAVRVSAETANLQPRAPAPPELQCHKAGGASCAQRRQRAARKWPAALSCDSSDRQEKCLITCRCCSSIHNLRHGQGVCCARDGCLDATGCTNCRRPFGERSVDSVGWSPLDPLTRRRNDATLCRRESARNARGNTTAATNQGSAVFLCARRHSCLQTIDGRPRITNLGLGRVILMSRQRSRSRGQDADDHRFDDGKTGLDLTLPGKLPGTKRRGRRRGTDTGSMPSPNTAENTSLFLKYDENRRRLLKTCSNHWCRMTQVVTVSRETV